MVCSKLEVLENMKKKFRIGTILLDDLNSSDDDIVDTVLDEVEISEEDILQVCHQSLPLGHIVCLTLCARFFGEWQFDIRLKLKQCTSNVGVESHVEYLFDLISISTPVYTGELWDAENDCSKIDFVNELLELPKYDLIATLLEMVDSLER